MRSFSGVSDSCVLLKPSDRLKISSDSSEGVEDLLLADGRSYVVTDMLDDEDG